MTRLHDLYSKQGTSPWLDNLQRRWFSSGELVDWVSKGIRGLTSNPTIFTKAILASDDYDEDYFAARRAGMSVEQAYWCLVKTDIENALEILHPIYIESASTDGFVSVEVDPKIARDGAATYQAAKALHQQIDAPNLLVKIPGTREGLPAIQKMISQHYSINVTLIFSLERYLEVTEAYLSGLEEAKGDLSKIASVASFFVSRLDTHIDKQLEALDTSRASSLIGHTAIASAKLAYMLFQKAFSGPRWEALVARGAQPQRLLWASTSTKNPDFLDTVYVDELIGPDTVNTLVDDTARAFMDHGSIARTIDMDLFRARDVFVELSQLGIDFRQATSQLEAAGVESFAASFEELLTALAAKDHLTV